MLTTTTAPHFLLQITLLKTSNPVVSRLLSVPATITFWELHEAIEARFGWTGNFIAKEESDFPTFIVVKGNAFEAERVEHLDVLLGPVTEGDDSDVNGDGFPSMKRVRLHEVLDNFRFRENLINYAYDESFFHVIHVLGRSIEKPNDRIVCLVRQGFTTQKLWDRGRTARHKTVHGGSSSWDLDLDEINARVQEVEDRRLCLETLRRRPQPS